MNLANDLPARSHPVAARPVSRRCGVSLVVVVTSLAIALTIAVLAAPTLQEWRPEPTHYGCDHRRALLQEQADQFFVDHRRWPDRQLESLATDAYWGQPVEPCPTSGARYQMFGTVVACPVHEVDRTE